MRKLKILGLLVVGGILLFVGAGPVVATDGEVEAAPRSFKAEFLHDNRDGRVDGSFFCMPEDAKLIAAEMRDHRSHGHSVQVRMLPRRNCD